MQLGTFSISLTVKDLRASLEFYQKLGFEIFHGEIDQKWIILKNGKTTIVQQNRVRASYNKAEYLDGRIRMMQAYADHLDELSAGRK